MTTNHVNMTIGRILVPIDFSDNSLNACYFALHLAARTGAEIRLFHAFFNPMVDAMTFPDTYTYQSNMAEVFRELESIAGKEMKRFKKQLGRYAGLRNMEKVKIDDEIIAGQPGEEISNVINAYQPGIIIIGTRGHGEQGNEILGSVATKVIDSSGIPVLLVTRDASLKDEEIMKVLYITNFDDSDYKALQSLIEILSGYKIKIDCVHFNTGRNGQENLDKMEAMKKNLQQKYNKLSLECHVIQSDDILEGLDKFVENNDIDLIALTHRKRNFFYRILNPSLAKKLLFQTKRPVFVFN
jgi:nucleotide-binding universal stress UspA family protein